MKRKWRHPVPFTFGLALLGLSHPLQAAIVLTQDFDIDPVNYTTTEFFVADYTTALGTRYYNLSSAAGINLNPGITGGTGNYIAVQNADTSTDVPISPAYSDAAPPTLTFDPVGFSLGAGEQLQLSMSIAGLPSVEAVNFIRAQVDLDGSGTWTNVFNFTGGPDNTAYKFGAASLTGAFATFTYPIPNPTDGVLRLRVQSFNDTNSLNEASGYDNVVVSTFAPVPQFGTALAPANTHFSEPTLGSINYVRGTNPPGTELGFTTTGGTPQGVTDYSGNQQFQINNAGATFRTELIDLRTTGAVTAGIDLRTYDISSGFEVADFLRAFVEVSTDGLNFTKLNFFDSNGVDGNDNDPLDLLETGGGGVNGPFTHFSLSIDASIAALRFGVDGLNNSANEFMIFDNLTLVLAQFPGDADGSGTVDFTDLGILLNSYNQPGTFETGDFDGSGTVDFTDLGILLNNYNQSAPTLTTAAPVPEPSSMVLAGLGLVGLLSCVRRRRQTQV